MTETLMLYIGALTLGAFHAFEPGHGKTLIAAYMIGTKGRPRDGVLLGGIVTFTHTFSVILLGLAASLLAKRYSDDQLHNWLGLVSAGLILGVGIWMLRQRLFGSGGHRHFHLFGKSHSHAEHYDHHNHNHGDDHSHNHHEHTPRHDHAHNSKKSSDKLDKRHLLLLGISGGLIPCPSAIAVLLAAVAAGKIAEGLSITMFFSLGLGLVMMSIGVALSQTGRLTQKISDNQELGRRMGIASSAVIVCYGFYTMFNSVNNIWF